MRKFLLASLLAVPIVYADTASVLRNIGGVIDVVISFLTLTVIYYGFRLLFVQSGKITICPCTRIL